MAIRKEVDELLRKPKHLLPASTNKCKKSDGATHEVDSLNEKILSNIERINEKLGVMNKEILRLKQDSQPVIDELVDVQLQKSVINTLDDLKTDDSQELSEVIKHLIGQKNKVQETSPDFLEKISLAKDGTVHGKLSMHDGKWKFFKRAKPIIYGAVGAVAGCLSLFVLLVLLKALGVLPGWI